MGLDYGEGGTGSYSYATYGTGIGNPTPEELEGYGNNAEGNEQDPGYEQEAPGATTEKSLFGLKMSNFFGGDDDCAVGANTVLANPHLKEIVCTNQDDDVVE